MDDYEEQSPPWTFFIASRSLPRPAPDPSAPHLGVAPLRDALPAEEVSTGGAGGVSPVLQAEDAAGSRGARGVCALRTAGSALVSFQIGPPREDPEPPPLCVTAC